MYYRKEKQQEQHNYITSRLLGRLEAFGRFASIYSIPEIDGKTYPGGPGKPGGGGNGAPAGNPGGLKPGGGPGIPGGAKGIGGRVIGGPTGKRLI